MEEKRNNSVPARFDYDLKRGTIIWQNDCVPSHAVIAVLEGIYLTLFIYKFSPVQRQGIILTFHHY